MAKKVVNPKMILHITAKCSDNCYARLDDKSGKTLQERNSYVPEMMPGQEFGEEPDSHYGDYVVISIDIETGQILNWKKPSEAAIKRFIKTGK